MIQESLFKRISFILAAAMLLGALAGCASNSGPTNPNPPSPTNTPLPTFTSGPSLTPTPTSTFTLTSTPTLTGTSTNTHTPVPSATPTSTGTPTSTSTPSSTPTNSFSPTPTASSTPSGTPTLTSTATASFTVTNSPTVTSTPTQTFTRTTTPTPNATACGAFSPFGNNSSSPTTYISPAGLLPEMVYSSFNNSQTSTLWDIKVNLSTDNYPMTMQAGIYNQDTGQLVSASAAQYVDTTPSMTWVQFNMPAPKTLVPGNYILAFLMVNGQLGFPAPLLGGNTGGTNVYDVWSSPGFTSTFNSSGVTQKGGSLEIYADVCGAPPTPTPTFFATPCSSKAFLGSQAYSNTNLGANAVSELVYSAFTLSGSDSFVLWDVQASLNTYSTSVATYQVAVYNQTSGALVAESAQQPVSTSSATQWVQFNMTQPQTLVPGSYLLALWMPSSNAAAEQLGQSPYGSNFNIIDTYSGFTSTFNSSGSNNYSGTLGIYAETCALNPTPTPAVIPTLCSTPGVFGDKSYFESQAFNTDEFHYAVFNQPGPGNETLFDVQAYVGNSGAGYPITLQAGVYDQGSGTLIATSAVTALDNSGGGGIQWTQLNLPYPQTLVPGNYILGVWAQGGSGNVITDPSGGNNHFIVPYFSGFTPSFNNSGQYGGTSGSENLSIYGDICP